MASHHSVMIFLSPRMGPIERLTILEDSARFRSTRLDLRDFVRRVHERLPRHTETDLARALLALVAAAPWIGETETDGSRGQWLDDNVLATIRDGGDCVDRTHALLALAYAGNLDGQAVWVDEKACTPSAPLDHVVARLRSDGLWHWADPLARPAVLGTAPQCGAVLTTLIR